MEWDHCLTVHELLPLLACGERVGVRGPFRKLRLVNWSSWRGPLTRNLREERANSDLSPLAGRSNEAAPISPDRGLKASGIAAAVVAAFAISTAALGQASAPPTDAEILAIMNTHCVACHAAEPTHEAFARAPAGILLENIAQVAGNAERIMTQVVVNRAMPLGNQTGMTDEERNRIAAWIEGRNK